MFDDPVDQGLQFRLVVEPVDVEKVLRFVVVGRQFLVAEGPAEALVVRVRLELVRREPQQRGTVPLGLAAHVIEFPGNEGLAVAVHPGLLVLEAPGPEHGLDVERAAIAGQETALLQ